MRSARMRRTIRHTSPTTARCASPDARTRSSRQLHRSSALRFLRSMGSSCGEPAFAFCNSKLGENLVVVLAKRRRPADLLWGPHEFDWKTDVGDSALDRMGDRHLHFSRSCMIAGENLRIV